ncbi:M48 family metallopeptidase [Marinobacter caseinilyticus]|uniref:M48 family metallopeptidase n=1 Tax=Marinobacter caseinilyticus TaxID=2692195 RepID=UPI00140DED7B|nr:M48 family metallopeptidase [Marinobacter caseinilyticus]
MLLTSNSPPSDVTLQGQYFQGKDSRRRAAVLRSAAGVLALDAGDERRSLRWPDIRVSPRIGNTPRYLYLPDGGVFETHDNNGIDALSRQLSKGRVNRWLHRLENHLGLILVASVVTIASVAFTFVYGIPWTARAIATALPASVATQLGEATLDTLDAHWLSPSQLPEARQRNLRTTFAAFLRPVNGQALRVEFRASPVIGANALALPDGTLIFTDDLVTLATRDEELIAILAHEVGHVSHNHGLQGVVQSSLTAWIAVMMTGDLSSFSDATVLGPATLANLAYSRSMESEADHYALQVLLNNGIDPIHFANIMTRMQQQHEGIEPHSPEHPTAPEPTETDRDAGWQETLGGLLSSHPLSRERIRVFEDASDNR